MTSKNSLDFFLNNTSLPSYPWFSKEQMLQKVKETKYDEVRYFKYLLDHDGYDQDGPESNIHDIFIWYIKDNKFYIDQFHTEEWYRKDSKPVFELCDTYEISSKTIWLNLTKDSDYKFKRNLYSLKKV